MLTLTAKVLGDTAKVLLLVFAMMLLVDLLNVWTRGRISVMLRSSKPWRQYVVAPIIAVLPGCMGAFSVVSLYIHGMITFGALTGAMLAASGDEAFVMLALFPEKAILLFVVLAFCGMVLGRLTDSLVRRFKIKTCEDCPEEIVHPSEGGIRHYLRHHVWGHILRRHLWRTALWTFGALLIVELGMQYANLSGFASQYPLALLSAAALLGLIPESGPHLIFVTLFANGLVPFSVLLTSSIVQDGHGMLPMLAHSVRASLVLKVFNFTFGLVIGLIVYLAGS
jgi:Putative, 10TM heavy-metal exporter